MSNMNNTQSSKTKSSIKKKSNKQTKPADTSENGFANSQKAKKLVKKNVGYTVPHLYTAAKHDCHRCSRLNEVCDTGMPVENMFLSARGGIQVAVIRRYLPPIEDYQDLKDKLIELDDDREHSLAFAVGVESKNNTLRHYYIVEYGEKIVIGRGMHLYGNEMILTDVSIYQHLPHTVEDKYARIARGLVAKEEVFKLRLGKLAIAYIAMIYARLELEYNLGEGAQITMAKMSKANMDLYREFRNGTSYIYLDEERMWIPRSDVGFHGCWGYLEGFDLMDVLADLANGTNKVLR